MRRTPGGPERKDKEQRLLNGILKFKNLARHSLSSSGHLRENLRPYENTSERDPKKGPKHSRPQRSRSFWSAPGIDSWRRPEGSRPVGTRMGPKRLALL